jgi:UDPglucose 6-dehydrogenase
MIGAGYVGLVSGTCFAEFGVQVVCADNDEAKVAALQSGKIPIYEPGLDGLVERNVREGRLSFTTDTAEAVKSSLVVFMIVTKSTVPVGTSAKVRGWIEEELAAAGRKVRFSIASNPEFLREGAAIGDFMRPDRVVIGTEDVEATAILSDLYRPLYLIEAPVLMTDIPTAELTKYAANAFLATKISFINEMANLCEKVGADVHSIARGIGLDRRIGSKFLHPGPGFGGSCFPKDTRSVAHFAREIGQDLEIIESVIRVNERQRELMIEKIVAALDGDVDGKTIGVLGLSFKPETDDMRDAPSIDIVRGLEKRGAQIRAYDPQAMREASKLLPDLVTCGDSYEACDGADALVLITEWNQFRMLDLARIKSLLRQPVIVDLRNVYEPGPMQEAGFRYFCVGR